MEKAVRRLAAVLAFGLVIGGGLALAHPNHKIMGTVTKVTAEHVIMKDRAGKEVTIKLAKTTKVSKNRKPMKAGDIPIGARVVVTAVSDEDLTAKAIDVGVVAAK